MSVQHKRKKYFIDRKFQTDFILKFSLIVILASILVAGLIIYLTKDSTMVTIENTRVLVKSTKDILIPLAIQTVVIVGFLAAFAVGILTLLVSHKISGPLFRITKEIGAIGTGDLRRNFSTRSNDQLKNLSKSLLEMSGALQTHINEVKFTCLKLKDSFKHKNISDKDKEEFTRLIFEIEKQLERFKT